LWKSSQAKDLCNEACITYTDSFQQMLQLFFLMIKFQFDNDMLQFINQNHELNLKIKNKINGSRHHNQPRVPLLMESNN